MEALWGGWANTSIVLVLHTASLESVFPSATDDFVQQSTFPSSGKIEAKLMLSPRARYIAQT